MAIPTTRAEFKAYCLRALGAPILEINVTDEQVEDRIDYALKMFADYHFDGSEKVYFKYLLTANNRPDRVFNLYVADGGTAYSNSDTVSFTSDSGENAAATITTDANGTIISADITNHGQYYSTAPTVTVTTSTGSGASITAELGGWVPIPENIMGVINIFEPGGIWGNLSSVFSARYQLIASELYSLSSASLIPYYMTMQHVTLMEQILVGQSAMRYNRHKNRLYLDTDWDSITDNSYLIAEAYEVIDPNQFRDVWKDRWLAEYTIELIKKQWGTNTKKFKNVPMLGGTYYSGQEIYDEATAALAELKQELIYSYSIPAVDMVG
jgi:hypothetical protein